MFPYFTNWGLSMLKDELLSLVKTIDVRVMEIDGDLDNVDKYVKEEVHTYLDKLIREKSLGSGIADFNDEKIFSDFLQRHFAILREEREASLLRSRMELLRVKRDIRDALIAGGEELNGEQENPIHLTLSA